MRIFPIRCPSGAKISTPAPELVQSLPSTSQRNPSANELLTVQNTLRLVSVLVLVTSYTRMVPVLKPTPTSATYNLLSSGEKQIPFGLCKLFVITGITVALPLVL